MKLSPVPIAILSALVTFSAQAENTADHSTQVIVTASKIDQPLSEVAGSVVVLDHQALQQRGVTELYDALQNESGVTVTGGAGRPQNIVIRGITGNRIQIIKDGIRSADGFGANDINDQVGRNSFSLSTIKSIQVVKGASSSVYGSGAIGGAVVVETMQPEDYLKYRDSYQDISAIYTGISNKFQSDMNLAFRTSDFAHLFTASAAKGEETRNFNEDLYQRDLEEYGLAYAATYDVNDEILLRSRLEYYNSSQLRNEGTNSVQPDGLWNIESFDQDETIDELMASIDLEFNPENPQWFDNLKGKIYWRKTEADRETNRLMNQLDQNQVLVRRRELERKVFSDQVTGAKADFRLDVKEGEWLHQLAYGFEATASNYQRSDTDQILDSDGSRTQNKQPFAPARGYTLAGYVRDLMDYQDWSITTGLRLDFNQLTPDGEDSISGYALKNIQSQELSPSLSLSYRLQEDLNIYASYNHGFRAPGYDKAYGFNLHDFVPITPFVIVPNNNLKAETSDAIELGTKYDNGDWQLSFAVFYSKFKDFIDIRYLGTIDDHGNFERQYQNVAGVKTYGAELSSSWWFSPSWQVSNKLGYVTGKNEDGDYVRSITPLEGSLTLAYQRHQLSGYAALNWAAAMNRAPTGCDAGAGQISRCATTSAWGALDVGTDYQYSKNLKLSANIYNLLDREYIRYQDVAGILESDKVYSTEPGRYFTVSANYQF